MARDADVPTESSTLTLAFIGWQCDVWTAHIVKPDMKMTHAQKTHCHSCYNGVLSELGENTLTQRQFQRRAKLQHAEIRSGLSAEVFKLTERAAKFQRTPEQVEASMAKLNDAKLTQAKAATDYLAVFWDGLAGLYIYICRDERPVHTGQLLRIKELDGTVSRVDGNKALWQRRSDCNA